MIYVLSGEYRIELLVVFLYMVGSMYSATETVTIVMLGVQNYRIVKLGVLFALFEIRDRHTF